MSYNTEMQSNNAELQEILDAVNNLPDAGSGTGTPGVGIASIQQTTKSTEDDGVNVITVTLTDGNTATFEVENGSKGSNGYSPVKGTDYWTPADKQAILAELGSQLSLGIASDGLIYLFVNGSPVGTGIPQSTGASGDVFGYVDENNTIVLTGALAEGTYSIKYEMEDGSTVDIGNLELDSNVYYSITNSLTNCTNSNSTKSIVEGESYSATITANDGYELSSVKVTMGGTDVSSSAVSGGTINIANVTGNIVITATATEIVVTPECTNFADPTSADWKEGYRLTTNIDGLKALTGGVVTNYIAVQPGDTLMVEGINFEDTNNRIAMDGSYGGIAVASVIASTWVTNGSVADVTYDSNTITLTITNKCTDTENIRFSGLATGTSADVVVNIKRNGAWL